MSNAFTHALKDVQTTPYLIKQNRGWLNRLGLSVQPDESAMQSFWKPFYKNKGFMDAAVVCQWYYSDFELHGIQFRTAEHAMMYFKAKLFGDQVAMDAILKEKHPAQVKNIGRQVQGFRAKLWDEHKVRIVREVTRAKFTQNATILGWLLQQRDDTLFVETSPYDAIWGIKMDDNHPDAMTVDRWQGENLLGFIATEVFQEIHQCRRDGKPIVPYKG